MGPPAAKKNDTIVAVDIHNIITPSGAVVPVPHPFNGIIDGVLSQDVNIMSLPAATVDSTATNTPAHVPIGGSFQTPPSNKATIIKGSSSVNINGKPAARLNDIAETCNDPADLPVGKVVAAGTVLIGG